MPTNTEHADTDKPNRRERTTTTLRAIVEGVFGVAFIGACVGILFLGVAAFTGIVSSIFDKTDTGPDVTYQCLVDTYLTDHLDVNPDTAHNYSINSGDGLWLHADDQPILKIDATLFAEGISRC